MDRSITHKIAYQQLIQYKRQHMRDREGVARENIAKEGAKMKKNNRVVDDGITGTAYNRFSPNSPSTTPASNIPYNVYVHSKLFLYLGLLDTYDDLLSPSSVGKEKDTNPPTSSSLPLLQHYSHIWFIDHDINLTGFNLTNYLHTLHTARFPSTPGEYYHSYPSNILLN